MQILLAIPPAERHDQSLRFVKQWQRVTISQICGQLSVSTVTAWRDLEALAEQGRMQWVYSGAVATQDIARWRSDPAADLPKGTLAFWG
jgi:DeoR/GlpR family transcriptional regulator of sugar metabolism